MTQVSSNLSTSRKLSSSKKRQYYPDQIIDSFLILSKGTSEYGKDNNLTPRVKLSGASTSRDSQTIKSSRMHRYNSQLQSDQKFENISQMHQKYSRMPSNNSSQQFSHLRESYDLKHYHKNSTDLTRLRNKQNQFQNIPLKYYNGLRKNKQKNNSCYQKQNNKFNQQNQQPKFIKSRIKENFNKKHSFQEKQKNQIKQSNNQFGYEPNNLIKPPMLTKKRSSKSQFNLDRPTQISKNSKITESYKDYQVNHKLTRSITNLRSDSKNSEGKRVSDNQFWKKKTTPNTGVNYAELKIPKYKKVKSVKVESIKSKELSINDFQLGLSKGQCKLGKIFPARHISTGFLCAIKKITKMSINNIEQFIKQVKVQSFINSPFVVRIYGCFADSQHIYLISEYMEDGSLFTQIKLRKKLNEKQTINKTKQIISGVKQMHVNGISHNSLNSQSILLTHNICKVNGFGSINTLKNESQYEDDLRCLGLVIYEMLFGKLPFYNSNCKQTLKKMKKIKLTFPVKISSDIEQMLQQILKTQSINLSIQNIQKQYLSKYIQETIHL